MPGGAPNTAWMSEGPGLLGRRLDRRIKRKGLRPRYAAYVIVVAWVIGVVVFGVVERLVDPGTFDNIWLGMWWAIVAINQIGSTLFMISALAAFTRPVTGSAVNVDVSNWGTLTGALCFAIGGVMQAFDMPPRRPAKADPHFTRSG